MGLQMLTQTKPRLARFEAIQNSIVAAMPTAGYAYASIA
ncbi:hypothetical protein GXM_03693 [Nostoc sphaeroides CCNUC1]|uniref:Uncharacterized protein n=1 Tax=Nostoc sphaeroides CCNUC1 TaxID=2653204 RepID=A0A5P8W0K2_9NOSO|nr:hypothetical protein GXM_03693 [Nostoc sphaeroides CCNUC1]